jgi:site-specific recombinase XerD
MKHLILQSSEYELVFKDFDEAIKTIGYNDRKETYYSSNVREFLFFLEQNGIKCLSEVSSDTIAYYYQYLCNRTNYRRKGILSPITVRHQMTSLKLLFEHLLHTDYLKSAPFIFTGSRPIPYKRRNIATVEEIRAMFNTSTNLRNKALLACAYGCGLRRGELERLNLSDINFSNQVLVVRIAKGGKSREVPLSNEMFAIVRKYNSFWRTKHINSNLPTNSFLISDKGIGLKGAVMSRILKSIIHQTGIDELINKNITLHCLRHSIATHLMDNRAGVQFVQQLLGHSDIDTTNLYATKRKRQSSLLKKLF